MIRLVLPLALASGLILAACSASPSVTAPRPTLQTGPPEPEAPAGRPLVVMNLAAHPDDEDGLTMAYYRGHRDAMVYSVIYTRGEGGQNEAGPELYERLGAIRTRETEAAARVLGTQVYFLNHYDFGYSKHARESFAEWSVPRTSFWDKRPDDLSSDAGRDSVTAGLVRLYRLLKPDVVFTNHDTVTVGDDRQHGQHQAVGISGYDAFALAADPSYHPEQLDEPGVDLWQPKRLFLRRGGFASGAPEAYDVAVPVSSTCEPTAYRPEESCAERAVAGASLHVSQGFDVFAPRFYRDTTYFQLLRSAPEAPALASGATDLAAELVRPQLTEANAPEGSVLRYLAEAAPVLDEPGELSGPIAPMPEIFPPSGEAIRHLAESGRVERIPYALSDDTVVPGQEVTITWDSRADNPMAFFLDDVPIATANMRDGRVTFTVPDAAPLTIPVHRGMYRESFHVYPLVAAILDSNKVVTANLLPLAVAPPVVAELPAEPVALRDGENRVPLSLTVYDPTATSVTLDARVWWDGRIRLPMATAAAGDDQTVPASTPVAALSFEMEDQPPGPYEIELLAQTDPGSLSPLPFVDGMPAAILPDVSVAPGLRVGFVRSYDGTMGTAMTTMGASVTDLDSLALARGDFEGLDTIVIDIRAYLEREDLRQHNDKLLAWVARGGHLVVGYQKLFEWNSGRTHPLQADETNPDFAPFPLELGRERITMENVPVTVTMPEHPLFTAPHAITATDWEGWVQERGLYFPTDDADERYVRPLAMADAGEAPLTTGILLANVGEGTYLYSPLVWYRQLAALNPGAWRLFANLVSLPLTDGR
ncbi:PIG-L family deacetylase [Rubricoccus marinus]|uniref:PIG-L family deacetylase n=1 Tax=Rubricoccus marinus TaxID=716817 RepID=A0A259TY32_9BACT|nr:PIG-L family deacetylase [Rubricoccus marinus]OZC02659.1 hypothetical protein BSZ36_06525 [Rubricoccus marinus]